MLLNWSGDTVGCNTPAAFALRLPVAPALDKSSPDS
jgi:hypothetical protein